MSRPLAPAAVLTLAAAVLPVWSGDGDASPRDDGGTVQAGRELRDSLAGALLQLSAATRRMDMEAISGLLSDEMAADGFPSVPGSLRREVKWISSHDWTMAGPAEVVLGGKRREPREGQIVIRAVGKEEFLGQVRAFLIHFSELHEARFELGKASFSDPAGARGTALVSFEAVGRDQSGRREWVRGLFDLAAERTGGSWRITRWHTSSLRSELSNRDLFSDVTLPSGIGHEFPPFGVPPNGEFLPRGGAVGDADGDGLMDLLLTEMDGARLYINDGRGGFRDLSESTLPRRVPQATGAAFLDYDQDGDSDIFLSTVGQQMLLENRVDPNGHRRFHDVSRRARVNLPAVGLSVAVADVNLDGLPDVYVTSYNRFGSILPDSWTRATNGTPNLLFVNIGSGRFRESARDWGVADARWGSAAAFADANGDGWQDLYLVNDFGENALFINKRTRFEDEAHRRGVAGPGSGTGVAWGDYDNDGDLDLHVTAVSPAEGLVRPGPDDTLPQGMASGSSLFMNRGKGWFDRAMGARGELAAGWAFGGGFIDFDNDGWEDELLVTGFVSGRSREEASGLFWRHVAASLAGTEKAGNEEFRRALMDRLFSGRLSLAGYQRDALFLGTGDGAFREISGVSGLDNASDGRAAIFADFDNDGDYDVVTTALQGAARRLYRNNVGQESRFLRVTLQGTRSGPDACGAVVRLQSSRGIQTKIKSCGSGFLSVHDPRLLFGLGEDESAEWLEVRWPSGLKQKAEGLQAGDSLKIVEGSESTERVQEVRFQLPDPPDEVERALSRLKVVRGKGLPALQVAGLDGTKGSLRSRLIPGRRTVLYLWATWCAPCRGELEELAELHPLLEASGVNLIAVSLDTGGAERVRPLVEDLGLGYLVLVAAGEEEGRRLVRGEEPSLPFTLLLDERGAVQEAFLGWSPRARETLRVLAGGS